VTSDRPHRPRLFAPSTVDRVAAPDAGCAEAELLERLEEALAALPADERAAAVVAFGMAEGSTGVAAELGMTDVDAEALTRSALQLLRGAFGELEPGADDVHARLRRRRRRTAEPGDPSGES
jgi:DNA-directed RNA polymerase specialized sigma24 family protein